MNRRAFVTGLTAASAARVFGANERVRAGVIGTGGRGTLLLGLFKELGAEVAAVCDVYEPNRERALKAASPGARPFDNYKALLDDKTLDVVVIATPDHWHATMAIDAAAAGKDMYIEKPLAHTIDEGFRIIEAVRRHKRVAQVGTQRRSSELFQDGKRIMQAGTLGDVHLVNSWWVNYQANFPERQLAGKLDWDQWLGPAPKRELDPRRFGNWYYYWDYSGGMLIGQGAHVIDFIGWYMGSKYPAAVNCTAVRPNVAGAETPETISMAVEYPEGYLAVFTLGYRAMRYHVHNDQMTQYHGTRARFDVEREAYTVYPQSGEVSLKPADAVRKPGSFNGATVSHIRNLLECVKSRQDPNAPVEAGQYANVALCMAMDSVRTGRRVRFDAEQRKAI